MTYIDRLQIKTLVVGITLIPLTALSVYLIYGPDLFLKWPWMRFSTVMAILTCLWTYAFAFTLVTEGDKLNPIFFGMAVIPFDVILMYPGAEGTGIQYGDSDFLTLLFVLEFIHGFGFYFIGKGMEKYLLEIKVIYK